MSCENCKKALEIVEECQKQLREVTKFLKEEPQKITTYEPACMDLYKDRLLLKVTEAGAMCGFSRATAYQMLYNGEWANIAIRLSERSIRIPVRGSMEWIEQKREEL